MLGNTTWSEANQIIREKYSNAAYSIQFIDDSHINVSVNGAPDFLKIEINPLTYGDRNSPVYRITLISNVEVGALIALFGTPTDLILSYSVNDFAPTIRFKEGLIHVQTYSTLCNKVLYHQKINSISLYEFKPNYLWLSEPSSWRGLNRCYEFEEPKQ
jgi:hypothetical protein